MTDETQDDSSYETFRDCVFTVITEKLAPTAPKTTKRRKFVKGDSLPDTPVSASPPNDPSELADFSEYLASETFYSLPVDLRALTHQTIRNDTTLSDRYSLPLTLTNLEFITATLPPTVHDTLHSYGLISPPQSDTLTFLSPILTSYITTATTPPPPPSATRTTACELCSRSWIPLTYHHLIPRSTHARVLKRGWHPESALQNVAWLCRACHSFVHRMASNEELAREWFTVERMEEREDVRRWIGWIGRVRWKKT